MDVRVSVCVMCCMVKLSIHKVSILFHTESESNVSLLPRKQEITQINVASKEHKDCYIIAKSRRGFFVPDECVGCRCAEGCRDVQYVVNMAQKKEDCVSERDEMEGHEMGNEFVI